MKILLVMPSMDNGYWKKLGKKVGPKSEPLSLLYIATYLNQNNHKAEVIDCEAEGISLTELEQHIRKGDYDCVGVAMLTPLYTQAVNVCKLTKQINPKIKTIVGGSHPTLRSKGTLEDEELIDIAAVGEAELTFLDLLDAFEGKKELKDVDGIVYRENGKVTLTKPRAKLENLDELPIPDRSLIKMHLYRPSVSYYRRLPAYTIITTRGCPYRCTFCATAKTGYRMHSVERVVAEMKYLIEGYGAKEILIRDDTFTLNKKRTMDLCDAIIERGLNKKISWDCISRANLVDEEMLKKMKDAGCWGMHFGVEGGAQKLIDSIKKDTTLEVIEKAFRLCREIGINTRAYMMLGMPESTREDDLKTIEFAKKIDPDWAQFTICTPYPGTQMYDEQMRVGNVSSDWDTFQTWGGFSETKLPWVADGRTSDEIKELQRHALKSFYFRPKVIVRKMTNVDNFPILRKYVLGAMALAAGGSGREPE